MNGWTIQCRLCGRVHPASSACPAPGITITPNVQTPIHPTPNNCIRFIYGQGCHGCHNYSSCWGVSLTTTPKEDSL